jgi:hypothetical protein
LISHPSENGEPEPAHARTNVWLLKPDGMVPLVSRSPESPAIGLSKSGWVTYFVTFAFRRSAENGIRSRLCCRWTISSLWNVYCRDSTDASATHEPSWQAWMLYVKATVAGILTGLLLGIVAIAIDVLWSMQVVMQPQVREASDRSRIGAEIPARSFSSASRQVSI